MKKIMVSLPFELECELEKLKREHFHDKSYEEMYKSIILLGLEKSKDTIVPSEP